MRDGIKVIEILARHGHETRFAGGCVRDRLLKIEPSDYDLASTARPEIVSKILTESGFRVVPTGIDHGTVTVITKSGPVEVTTLRIDLSGDGRHAEIHFVDDFQADAARRDFTINAMFEDASGIVFDFFDGEKHLRAKEIHFVGIPDDRIREDYLRIMRFFRFIARFELQPDQATLASIHQLRQGLTQISQERITSEWRKILEADLACPAIQLMVSTGIYQTIFPQFPIPNSETMSLLNAFGLVPVATRFLGRQAILVLTQSPVWTKQDAIEFTQKFRLSTADQRCLQFLTVDGQVLDRVLKSQADAMEFLDQFHSCCGNIGFNDFAIRIWSLFPHLFSGAAMTYLEIVSTKKDHLRIAQLPITGQVLIKQLGMSPGPELGKVLAAVKRGFRNEEWFHLSDGLIFAKNLIN
jgi:tRNA nucleotidyltransferase/poly(A) polymerase